MFQPPHEFILLITFILSRLYKGVSKVNIRELQLYIREFLSCTKELDIQVCYVNMSDPTKKKKNKSNAASRKGQNKKKKNATDSNENDNDAWWMKPNYMFLQNLVEHARRFGPLLNLWDGGGMGEKSIQPFKALIKKGVREAQSFFSGVMEKLQAASAQIVQEKVLRQQWGLHRGILLLIWTIRSNTTLMTRAIFNLLIHWKTTIMSSNKKRRWKGQELKKKQQQRKKKVTII